MASGVTQAAPISQCAVGGTANVLAPWYCSQINQAVTSIWSQWEPIGFLAVILAFFFAALVFAFGVAMGNEKLRNFGVGEIYEAAASGIIVAFFLVLSATVFGILPSITTGPVNPYDTSLSYINGTINATQQVITSLYNVVMVDSFYSSVKLDIQLPGEGEVAGETVSKILNSLVSEIFQFFVVPANVLLSLLMDGLIALTAQFYMILFFMYLALPVFLIPGVIFRAIFPLRPIGGMLMAMAISFYLVMPLLFSVAYYFTNNSVTQNLQTTAAAITSDGSGTQAQTNAASATSPLVLDVNGLQSSMAAYFLSVLFYPALILGITYYSIKVLADFLGSVVDNMGKLSLL